MARLEAQSKLLYYPTPISIVDLLATWFKADHPVRLADPCCGTGEALRLFADVLGVKTETWGVELSNSRAACAARLLDHVLPTSFYAMTPSKWSSASVGLVFNNPPYDWSDIVERDEKGRERRVRHELLFVENVTRKIISGGHQVIIIPRAILGDEHIVGAAMRERFARHVLGWYEQVIITRFPDGEYERFKQVVVFAINKRAQYIPAGKDLIESICTLAHAEADLPIIMAGNGNFTIPVSPEKAHFTYTPIESAQLAQAANQCSPIGTEEYQRVTYVRPLGASFTPALPLSVGHVTMLITGQETGVLEVEQDDVPVLVKGMSRKVAVRKERPNEDAKGRFVSTSVTEKERHEATLTVAKPQSPLEMLADMESVGKFISTHATKITDAILTKNNPLYDFQPTPHEWEITGKSALGLPPLPGRSERGLFPVQRHFAIGATRVMRTHGTAILNCEMGFGKAQPLDAKVLTPTGWKMMGQIEVGDLVIGANGQPTQVVGVYPQGEKDIYRVRFSDESFTECCDGHLWTVNTPLRKWRGHTSRTLPLREIRKSLQHQNGNRKFYIPMIEPAEFSEMELPLDPYFLGLLLGDGSLSGDTPRISTADEEILKSIEILLPDQLFLRYEAKYDYRICGNKHVKPNPLKEVLRSLGVWKKRAETKFVPEIYKFSSSNTRLAILQGLLDTDGSSTSTNIEFSSVSMQLAEDVVFLVQSLGGIAKLTSRYPAYTYLGEKRTGQLSYRVTARLPMGIKPFRLSRKLATYVQRTKYADIPRAIKKVEHVGRKLAQCIKVANEDGLYVTDDFIVTHNTSVSISSLELLDKWPAVIMVPGHMVWKWKRDAERSSNPEAPIVARVITRPVLAEPGRWAATKSAIEAKGGTVTNLLRWQVDPVTTNDPGGRLRVELECATDKAGALAALFAQYTFKDEGKVIKPIIQLTQSGLSAEYVDRDEYTLFDFVNDYKAGRLGRKAAAVIAFDPAKYDAGAEEKPAVEYHIRRTFNEISNEWEHQRMACCPSCGHGYHSGSVPHFCSHEITEKVIAEGGEVQEHTRECGAPLFQMSRWRRVGLARLVQHKFRNFFKVYVADECFPGNTPIATPNGNIPIKDICIGDVVLTEHKGNIVVRKVTRIIRNPKQGMLLKIIHTNGKLTCTPNHKIFINGEFVRAETLKSGDELTYMEDNNDYKTMLDVRKHISSAQFPKVNLPTHLRKKTRSIDARRCGAMSCLRQGIHPNTNQERETKNLQPKLRCDTSRIDGNHHSETTACSSKTAHRHKMCSMWKRVYQHNAPKNQKVLLSQLSGQSTRENEQRLDSKPGMAGKSIRPHEKAQPNGKSRQCRKGRCPKTWAVFFWRSRRKWSVNHTTNRAGKCTGLGDGGNYSYQKSILASPSCRYRPSGSENRCRSRWRFSPNQEAEKQGSKKGRDVDAAGLVTDQILELAGGQRLGKVRVISIEYVPSEEQYVYNLEVDETHRYFARGVLVSNCHKAQNGKTDVGVADQRLLSATRYSLALTGTLFGGTASSLFYLLYRRVPEIRRLYAFSDVTRWVDHYGLWERQWDQSKPNEGEYGASTNIRRWNLRQRELPGIAPAVIRYLLPITLFGNITDLGYALPPVNEVVETLEMTGRQEEQYKHIEHDVLKDVLQALEEYGDVGGLSAWFSACRFRPASGFRDERIDYSSDKGTEIHVELPAVTSASHPWLPKETRLAEIVRENMAQGRKTLIFVEQSGTRDIRSRLAEALDALVTEEAHMVGGRPLWVTSKPRIGIMSAGDMSPAKREAWIKINAPEIDVLIVNPKLVETGLDLVQFSSLVFYETTVSLYTLWQAMRRVWRLGQDKEVNVTFLAYANTVEEEILRRMGQKKKAAQLLYGKEAAGVLVETDSDDVQREMIQAAIEGRAFRSAGELAQSLFSDGTEKKVLVSIEPTGSMVAVSLPITVLRQEPAKEAIQMNFFGEVIASSPREKHRKR